MAIAQGRRASALRVAGPTVARVAAHRSRAAPHARGDPARCASVATESGLEGIVARVVGQSWNGPRLIAPTPRPSQNEIAGAVGRLREAGFDTLVLPSSRLAAAKGRRHTALVLLRQRDAEAAADWVLAAAEVSPRGHMVLDLRPQVRSSRLSNGWRARGARHRRLLAMMRAGEIARADAILAAHRVAATLHGHDLAPALELASALVWMRQGRLEAARRMLVHCRAPGVVIAELLLAWLTGDGSPPPGARVRGSAAAADHASGRHTMEMLRELPALLHLVSEAEDEAMALERGCAWLRGRMGAQYAAVLDRFGSIVTTNGPASALSSDERRQAAACDRLLITHRPDGIVVAAPVRYAGERVGVVAASGDAMGEETLRAAAAGVAAVCAPALRARLDAIAVRDSSHARMPEILGRSPAIAALREAIVRAAASAFPVLIEGESGCGKELVARAIHRLGARRDRRFAALNCAALTDELAETELFGHARGAFTGAVGARAGLFEEAHLGTLFLDEAAELSPRSQARLLRVLQEGEVRRIGENTPRAVDVRVVSATNRPLAALAAEGRFREDLLFRLAVIRLRVPPLRDRPEDVPLLAMAVWRSLSSSSLRPVRAVLGPDAIARLVRHPWPGNVRELQNVMAALAVAAPARGRVSARHVEHVLAETGRAAVPIPVRSLDSARLDCERRAVLAALARHAGRRAPAARELGLTRQGLAKAIKRLRVDRDDVTTGVA